MSEPHPEGATADTAQARGALARLVSQGLKFGVVGAVATGVHVAVFVLVIEAAGMRPLWANLPAFVVAVLVGFVGHFFWTFRRADAGPDRRVWRPLGKFAATSLFGLLLNTLVVYAVVDVLALPYGYAAVLMATAVPATIFLISKLWVFT